MTTVTENDLKRVEDKIDKLVEIVKPLPEKVQNIERDLAVINARLTEWSDSIKKVGDLSEKVGELKNWRAIGIVAVSGIISGTITSLFWALRLKP